MGRRDEMRRVDQPSENPRFEAYKKSPLLIIPLLEL